MQIRPARGNRYCAVCIVISGTASVLLACSALAQNGVTAAPGTLARAGANVAVDEATPSANQAVVHPQLWPQLPPALPPDPQLEARIDALLARMTDAQKVAQLIQADISSIAPADLRQHPLGSILNGGNSSPRNDKLAAPREWLDLADGFYDASMADPAAAVLPVLWGTDAVHGHNNLPGATIFPHNIALGATRGRVVRRILGGALAVTGVGVTNGEQHGGFPGVNVSYCR